MTAGADNLMGAVDHPGSPALCQDSPSRREGRRIAITRNPMTEIPNRD